MDAEEMLFYHRLWLYAKLQKAGSSFAWGRVDLESVVVNGSFRWCFESLHSRNLGQARRHDWIDWQEFQ